MIGLYKLMAAVFGVIAMIAFLTPSIFQYGSPSFANTLNFTQANSLEAVNTSVFQPLSNQTFGGKTNSTGLFGDFQIFNGLAFVFQNIGNVALALLNLPRIAANVLGTTLLVFGVPLPTASFLIGLMFEMVIGVMALITISYFGKFDLRS